MKNVCPKTIFFLNANHFVIFVYFSSCQTAYLGTIGGCSVQVATRRILSTLIGHSLATQLNSNQKRPFNNLRLRRVVTGKLLACDIRTSIYKLHSTHSGVSYRPICFSEAVRKCSFQPNPLDSEVEDEIKVWLRNSRDRAGGRKERYHRQLS